MPFKRSQRLEFADKSNILFLRYGSPTGKGSKYIRTIPQIAKHLLLNERLVTDFL